MNSNECLFVMSGSQVNKPTKLQTKSANLSNSSMCLFLIGMNSTNKMRLMKEKIIYFFLNIVRTRKTFYGVFVKVCINCKIDAEEACVGATWCYLSPNHFQIGSKQHAILPSHDTATYL